jgi:hypothetical protein
MSHKPTSHQDPPETTAAEPAAAEPPVSEAAIAETAEDTPKFADRVGKKKWTPRPERSQVVIDSSTGVQLFRSDRKSRMEIQFGDGSPNDKPSQGVLDKMHAAGWKWKSADRVWVQPFTPDSVIRKHIEAERLFDDVSQIIRQEKGVATGPQVPF